MNIKISILLFLVLYMPMFAMEELEYPEGRLLHQLEYSVQIVQHEKTPEKEFIDLIEDPFEQSEEETLKKLSWLLTHGGVNPHYERKSKYELIGFMPIKYLLGQLARATDMQKPRLEKMIQLIEAKK